MGMGQRLADRTINHLHWFHMGLTVVHSIAGPIEEGYILAGDTRMASENYAYLTRG